MAVSPSSFTITSFFVMAKSVEPVSTFAILTLVSEPATSVSSPKRFSVVPSTVTGVPTAVRQSSGVAVAPDALLSEM